LIFKSHVFHVATEEMMSITKRVALAGAGLAAMTSAAVAEIEIRAVKNGTCLSAIFTANNATDQVVTTGNRSVRVRIDPAIGQSAPAQIFARLSQVTANFVGPGLADGAALNMANCTGSWAGFCGNGRIERSGRVPRDIFNMSCTRVSGGMFSNNGVELLYQQIITTGSNRNTSVQPSSPTVPVGRRAPQATVAPAPAATTGGWFASPAQAAPVAPIANPAARVQQTETTGGSTRTIRACPDSRGCVSFRIQVR
jgi:hypothetical protein